MPKGGWQHVSGITNYYYLFHAWGITDKKLMTTVFANIPPIFYMYINSYSRRKVIAICAYASSIHIFDVSPLAASQGCENEAKRQYTSFIFSTAVNPKRNHSPSTMFLGMFSFFKPGQATGVSWCPDTVLLNFSLFVWIICSTGQQKTDDRSRESVSLRWRTFYEWEKHTHIRRERATETLKVGY